MIQPRSCGIMWQRMSHRWVAAFFAARPHCNWRKRWSNCPRDQRIAVEMRYLGQQSLKSIADYMEKTTGAVVGLIRRGVENLRDVVPPQFGEVS